MKLTPLNRKEAGTILTQIGKEYGCDAKSAYINEYTFFKSDKDKIYIITNAIKDATLEDIRINTLGLYFCELNRDNVRVSMEGSAMVGKIATKNVHELDAETARMWMLGTDIPCETAYDGFVILKHKTDFLGSGKYKNGMILNYVPKQRRIGE